MGSENEASALRSDRSESAAAAVQVAVQRVLSEVLTGTLLKTHRLWTEAERAAAEAVRPEELRRLIDVAMKERDETMAPEEVVWQVVDEHVGIARLEEATEALRGKLVQLVVKELEERVWDVRQAATEAAIREWTGAKEEPPPFLLGPQPSPAARLCALEVLALDGDEDAALLLHRLAAEYEMPPHEGRIEVRVLDGSCTGDESVRRVFCCGPCYTAGCLVEVGREIAQSDGWSRLSGSVPEPETVTDASD